MGFPLAKALLIALLLQQVGARQAQTGSVRGMLLTSAGTPLEGVRVAVEPLETVQEAGVLESIGLTDNNGRFLLENVSPGRYRLVFGRINLPVFYPGVTNRNEATTIVVVAGQVTDVPQMVSKTTSVSGRVLDIKTQRGRAVQSLVLCCNSDRLGSSLSGRDIVSPLPMKATVREDGGFIFPAVPPGDYYLHILDPEVVPIAQAISVERNDLENFQVRVTSGVGVTGQILDVLKRAVPSANVTLKAHPSNPFARSRGVPVQGSALIFAGSFSWTPTMLAQAISRIGIDEGPRRMTATPEGTFAFSGVLPGRYTLEMNTPGGYAFSREIEVGIDEASNITLDGPFAQITGQILVNNTSPLPKLAGSVRLVSPDPNGRIFYAFPDDSGRFSVLLAGGEYRIFTDGLNVDRDIESISYGSSELQGRRFVLDESRPQEIRITIAP